ncbi:hypothetical protein QR680_011176 [Steinernema hermaphroditum]|uniref:Cathepsin L-like n=1 Tax=Steinernema hermaphroditum TaxID=289476 RepID=A0AA39MCW9_9BILA|nr:hypothetical protein QR680_011176 [Steinernema hermaphroditum]
MKKLFLLLFAVTTLATSRFEREHAARELMETGQNEWISFKAKHNKRYESHLQDKIHKKQYFKGALFVEEHNDKYRFGETSFFVRLNSLSDLTSFEYSQLNGLIMGQKSSKGVPFVAPSNAKIPDSLDWREHGYVTEVKNQGMCGSCWAFSSTGALEGQHKRVSGKLVSLSEQNLIDCSTSYGNFGCLGGWMDQAFKYVKENGGIDTEASYPYVGDFSTNCTFKNRTVGATDDGFVDLPSGDEEALKVAVATIGPVSVAIDAGQDSFRMYAGGVYYDEKCSSKHLNHGVLVVGYGTDPVGGEYWLVKNSWGEDWGEKGYIKMARNRNNHCGIARNASYPIVSKKTNEMKEATIDYDLTFRFSLTFDEIRIVVALGFMMTVIAILSCVVRCCS